MNYELAKKLKDAGFPQETKAIGDKYFQKMGHPRMGIPLQWAVFTVIDPTINHPSLEETMIKIPTLSELIETMPLYGSLEFMRRKGGGWYVRDNTYTDGTQPTQSLSEGTTLEECVAKVFLTHFLYIIK